MGKILGGVVAKFLVALILFLSSFNIYSQVKKEFDFINANNVLMWVGCNASGSHDPRSDDSGLYWEEDVNHYPLYTTVFADGPVLGFKFNDKVNLQGSTYRSSFTPQPIGYGSPDTSYYISKIRKDWDKVGDAEYRASLKYHYENYPYYLGAPYNDVDSDDVYTPYIDSPGFTGDETLWWTSVCTDSNKSDYFYGSPPVNLEMRTKVWGEKSRFPDVVYKEYLFINHEKSALKDFYFGYWSDPDVGFATDDHVGVDTLLDMMYGYNGDDYDDDRYLDKPASVGYLLLDGPVVEGNNSDTARFNGHFVRDKKNLASYAFYFMIGGSAVFSDPDLGIYEGALQFYNILQGKHWNGRYPVDPNTGDSVKFCLAGDPIAKTGWYEGDGWPGGPPPGDRRMVMSVGPFDMEPGDTNCVSIAILNARDTGRLNSLAKLKQLAADVKYHWLYEVERTFPEPEIIREEPQIPTSFVISNNYPNPFNNTTSINLELPQSGNIKIVIYNALGEMVGEVNDHFPTAGFKNIQFKGAGLSSGVYYYTVLFRGETKLGKFILLK